MPILLPVGRILSKSCLDHGKIMARLFSPCNTVVVCVSYGLIGSLVALHDHGTCTLPFLGHVHLWDSCAQLLCHAQSWDLHVNCKVAQKWVCTPLGCTSSIAPVRRSRTTQLLLMDCTLFNVACPVPE